MSSETEKYRSLTIPFCQGNGIDIGSGGDPVVPWAIQVELSDKTYARYNSNQSPRGPLQYRDDNAFVNLPFKDGTLDFVYSSHLLEDFFEWSPLLIEWKRVLKPGGFLVILIPDRTLWQEALRRGQPPNDAHRHEGSVNELRQFFEWTIKGMNVIRDSLTDLFPGDYSILFVGQKT